MESKSERNIKFEHWLGKVLGQHDIPYQALPGDASFRSYYRVHGKDSTFIAMDAPPPENCAPFVAVGAALHEMGLQTPEVLAADIEHGFLLLSDFGDTTFLTALRQQPNAELADDLYGRALRALAVMQQCRVVPGHELKPFGREWMEREWAWHQEWFLEKWLGLSASGNSALHSCYELLILSATAQPQVFMHRDYHSANLMVLEHGGAGILDFQDAFIGPLTYDLASLLRDCYIDWPQESVQKWVRQYLALLRAAGVAEQVAEDVFMRWFDWMGLQRHIKALMTFARKFVRDQQPRYLEYVPRTLNYIVQVGRHYPELNALTEFYANTVQPAIRNAKTTCVP